MKIIQKRKFFFALSGMFLAISVFAIFSWKLKLGIDFTGGILMEFNFSQEIPSKEDIQKKLGDFNLGSLTIQPTQANGFILKFTSDDDSISEKIEKKIREEFSGAELKHVEFVSSVISNELKKKALVATIMAVMGVALYIIWAFRKVSYPVESWKYGLAAVLALIHDVIITIGVFSFLGKFKGIEVNISFIAAILTILGYSVNDTIVVFDRIRENLLRAGAKEDFEETVNQSIRETLARSINTSMTVLMVLICIILFGGESIRSFALALFVGVFFGTYSSIFIASAFIVDLWKSKRQSLA